MAEPFGGKSFVQRFRAEASAAAILQHPNIVAIHDVGVQDGQHFFSMDYVEGPNLAQLVGLRPLLPRQAARYLKLIAEAIHYAHEQGILHRDLKPSNVLIETATDQPRVTDFGLAKRLDGNSTLTLTGQLLGSPHFMPPEQASGTHSQIDRQTDVYGLRAILYHLLTAGAPSQGESLEGILRQISEAEPVSPRLLNPDVPSDLETICLKCLEKEPARRYATAEELADELGRFLNDEPVHARPVSGTEKVWRWCRRKPALATLGALVLALVLVIVLGAPIAVFRINHARLEANDARSAMERNVYASDMTMASEAFRDGAMGQVQGLLNRHQPHQGEEDLRGFEWRYFWDAVNQTGLVTHALHGLGASKIVVAPGLGGRGSTLYDLLEETDQILAWDAKTWASVHLKFPAQPASARWWSYPAQQAALAVNNQARTIAVYRLPAFEPAAAISLPGEASAPILSKDLQTLAVAFQDGDTQRILVWDLAANTQRWVFGKYRARVVHLVFSPDGTVLVVACASGEIGLWSITDGKPLPSPDHDPTSTEENWGQPPFFGSSSNRLFLNRDRERKVVEVWDWNAEKISPAYQAHAGPFEAFAFSPDGALFATAGIDGAIALLDAKELRQIGQMTAHGLPISALAFSPSGNLIASGDLSVRLWDVKTQRELQTLGGNDYPVDQVAFTPDEKSLVTLTRDGGIKVWDLKSVLERGVLWQTTNLINRLAVSANEKAVATADMFGGIHIWERSSGTEICTVKTSEQDANFDFCFSPADSDHILAWVGLKSVGILDYKSGESNVFPLSDMHTFSNPAFSSDGREFAFGGPTNVMIVDMITRKTRPFASIDKSAYCLAFSPNGALLACAQRGGNLTLWDHASGRETRFFAHPPTASSVEFSRDGRFLASGGWDGTAKLWEVSSGSLRLLRTLPGHVSWVDVTFSPDSRRVLSHSPGNALRIWDAQTGLEVGKLYSPGGFAGIAFSRDGNTIYSGDYGDVRIWHAPPLVGSRGSITSHP